MHPDDKDFFSWLIVTQEKLKKELDTPNENSNDRINYYETGYENGWNESAQEVAAILQDLIVELREAVNDYPPTVFREFTDDDPASQSRTVDRIAGVAMRHAWTRAGEMADRAEQRLREVQGE